MIVTRGITPPSQDKRVTRLPPDRRVIRISFTVNCPRHCVLSPAQCGEIPPVVDQAELQACKKLCAWKHCRLCRNILLAYLLTFTIALPMICAKLQNTLLDKLYVRNATVENSRLMQINAARYNKSVAILKLFSEGSNSMHMRKLLSGLNQSASVVTNFGRDSFPLNRPTSPKNYKKVDIVVTIITVSRGDGGKDKYNPKYLAQTLAAFIELFNSHSSLFDKFSPVLRVCNVDPRPEEYVDMSLVPAWIPVYQRFSVPKTPLENMQYDARLNKEKNDYVYCLDKSLEENTSFVLLVEDDALPREELFFVMETKIFSAFDYMVGVYPIINDVTFIKLYHPERLLGYISIEPERLAELFSIGLILTTIFMYVYLRNSKRTGSPKWLWVVLFLFFSVAILTVGRPNMLELRRVSSYLYQIAPAPSCCTPAMLFPRQGAHLVSDYLKTVTCKANFGKDSALDQLKKKKNLVTKLLVPNLFEHIGHFSSLRYSLLNPFIVS